MKKNNSLVKDVVSLLLSKPFSILIIILFFVVLSKSATNKIPHTTNITQPQNRLDNIVKKKLNQITQAIEMEEATKQKQKERFRAKKNITMLNDNLEIELEIINNSIKKVNRSKDNIIITNVKLTKDEPFTKFLLDKKIGYEITIPFASLEKDKNSTISQKSIEYQLFYRIKILGIKYDNN